MAGMGRISLGGLASGMDTDSMIKELMAVQKLKVDRIKKKNVSNTYRQEEWKKMNAKIYSFFNKEVSALRLKTNFIKTKISSSNTGVADIRDGSTPLKGVHELEVIALAKTAAATSGRLQTTGGEAVTNATTMQDMGLANKEFNITYKDASGVEQTISVTAAADETLSSFVEKVKKETKGKIDLEANVDIKNARIFLATKNTGEKSSFRLSGDIAVALGFDLTENKGADAEYRYNGLEVFKSDSNQIEVNGLHLNLKAIGQTTISVQKDTEAAYKQVTDFVKQYNVLVKDMQDKVNITIARSQRDMQPLTDEEKKAMSETDAKKWEETLRERVFKNDPNLKKILSNMRTILTSTSVENNGDYEILGNLGIGTGDFRQGTGAMLYVDGDSELGGPRSDRPNKLKQALDTDPEAVMELLAKIGEKLHENLSAEMKSTSLRSYMSFYDDKVAKEEYRAMEERIRVMEVRMEEMESRYRKQFLAMEKALSKANSTSSWLTQQLGAMR